MCETRSISWPHQFLSLSLPLSSFIFSLVEVSFDVYLSRELFYSLSQLLIWINVYFYAQFKHNRFDCFRFNVIYLIYDVNDIPVLKVKITCSMRLSARRANDSRRPELATGSVGVDNGGVDMLKMYRYVCVCCVLCMYAIYIIYLQYSLAQIYRSIEAL